MLAAILKETQITTLECAATPIVFAFVLEDCLFELYTALPLEVFKTHY